LKKEAGERASRGRSGRRQLFGEGKQYGKSVNSDAEQKRGVRRHDRAQKMRGGRRHRALRKRRELVGGHS